MVIVTPTVFTFPTTLLSGYIVLQFYSMQSCHRFPILFTHSPYKHNSD